MSTLTLTQLKQAAVAAANSKQLAVFDALMREYLRRIGK